MKDGPIGNAIEADWLQADFELEPVSVAANENGKQLPNDSNETVEQNQEARKPDFLIGDHVELSTKLVADLTEQYGTAPVAALGGLRVYEKSSGLWIEVTDDQQIQWISRYSGRTVAREKKPVRIRLNWNDITGIKKIAAAQQSRPTYFDAAPPGVHFTNGFLALTQSGPKLTKHSPDNKALVSVGTVYVEKSLCPKFDAFLLSIFEGDPESEQKIRVLQEFAGTSLFGMGTRYHRALVLIGEGSNGKSTFQDIITGVLPREVKAAVPPHKWTQDYSLAGLAGKKLNSVSELPNTEVLRTELFKQVISGDVVEARSPYEKPFTFRPVAGHLFSANELPGINDQSYGFWRRFNIIRFDRRFSGEQVIPGLSETIVKAEAAGILNWMVAGAFRLADQGRYTELPSSLHEIDTWKKKSDSVAVFVSERKMPITDSSREKISGFGKDGWAKAEELYREYKHFCEDAGFRAVASPKFAERMKAMDLAGKKDKTGKWYPVKDGRAVSDNGAPVEPPWQDAEQTAATIDPQGGEP